MALRTAADRERFKRVAAQAAKHARMMLLKMPVYQRGGREAYILFRKYRAACNQFAA